MKPGSAEPAWLSIIHHGQKASSRGGQLASKHQNSASKCFPDCLPPSCCAPCSCEQLNSYQYVAYVEETARQQAVALDLRPLTRETSFMSNAGAGSNSGSGSSRLCCWSCWGSETYVTPAWWSLLVGLPCAAWICSFLDPAEIQRPCATSSSCSCTLELHQMTRHVTISQAASYSRCTHILPHCLCFPQVLLQYRTARNYCSLTYTLPRVLEKLLFAAVVLSLYWNTGTDFSTLNVPVLSSLLFLMVLSPICSAIIYLPGRYTVTVTAISCLL